MSASWRAWLPVYRAQIERAAGEHGLEPVQLAALVWQESDGGVRWTPEKGHSWNPSFLYRYEPRFWTRYMAGKAEWAGPEGAREGPALELWKRRASASYGLAQLMWPTAVWLAQGERFEPEELFEPGLCLDFAGRLLRLHLDAGRTWRQALAAYNTGRARDDLTDYDDQVLEREQELREARVFVGGG